MNQPAVPRVLFWQRLYCAAMGGVYVLLVLGCIVAAILKDEMADATTSPGEVLVGALAIAAISVCCAAVFLAGLFLPRRRWAWVYHLVLIGIGMTSCACLPFVTPLLIFWIRPEVQAYFGGPAAPPAPAPAQG